MGKNRCAQDPRIRDRLQQYRLSSHSRHLNGHRFSSVRAKSCRGPFHGYDAPYAESRRLDMLNPAYFWRRLGRRAFRKVEFSAVSYGASRGRLSSSHCICGENAMKLPRRQFCIGPRARAASAHHCRGRCGRRSRHGCTLNGPVVRAAWRALRHRESAGAPAQILRSRPSCARRQLKRGDKLKRNCDHKGKYTLRASRPGTRL
jgi:hypothetical protein